MRLIIAAAVLALAAPAAAQDASNPGGTPLAPNLGPETQPTQAKVPNTSAPASTQNSGGTDPAPSATKGVEEQQRIDAATERKPAARAPDAQPADANADSQGTPPTGGTSEQK